MGEFQEVKTVIDKLNDAISDANLQKDVLDFKKREVIQSYWSNKANEIIELINVLENIVHDKGLMVALKRSLGSCIYNQSNNEEPRDGLCGYIQDSIDKCKENIPKELYNSK